VLASALGDAGVVGQFVSAAPSAIATEYLAAAGWGTHRIVEGSHGSPLGADAGVAVGELAGAIGATLVVVDSYQAEPPFLTTLAGRGLIIGALDDGLARDLTSARWVLNQNVNADRSLAMVSPTATVLRGQQYALLRSSFARARPTNRSLHSPGRLLIVLGGGDVARLHEAALAELEQVADLLEVRCLLPRAAAEGTRVLAAAKSSRHDVELVAGFDDPTSQMLWCDLALTAGGYTTLELMCLGVPMIIRPTSTAEEAGASDLEARGCAMAVAADTEIHSAISRLVADPDRLRAMTEMGMSLVDGLGAPRTAASLLSLVESS
jgi:UDP-2,4-diacetamido-2,4,6-trideoxy-beta-L-altropyranose hydrolase